MTNLMNSNEESMSSREIAQLAKRRHSDVIRTIRNISKNLNNAKMRWGCKSISYIDSNGQERIEYLLDQKAVLNIASKYDDATRTKIIDRWYELETHKSLPQTFAQALRLAAEQQEQIEKQNKIIEIQKEQKFIDQKLIDVLYDKSDREDLIPKWRKY